MNSQDRRAAVAAATSSLGKVTQGERLYAIATDAEVWEEETHVDRPRTPRGTVRHKKGGTITLVWDRWVDEADHSQGVITVVRRITVSRMRAVEAEDHLDRNHYVI